MNFRVWSQWTHGFIQRQGSKQISWPWARKPNNRNQIQLYRISKWSKLSHMRLQIGMRHSWCTGHVYHPTPKSASFDIHVGDPVQFTIVLRFPSTMNHMATGWTNQAQCGPTKQVSIWWALMVPWGHCHMLDASQTPSADRPPKITRKNS